MANPFTNRIIGYGTKPADQFQANPQNWRKHPQRQRDAVQASLRELGWIGVVVENTVTGHLIDGHERVWQALQVNEDVPYIQVELSEADERLALAVFDPITYMAETDTAILDALLRDVNTGEAALQELLAGLAADNGIISQQEQAEEVIDVTRDKGAIALPDSVYATDNEWGIPLLDINLQARSLVTPFTAWGSTRKAALMGGTWHFYTEDVRYTSLWGDPAPVVTTKCVNAAEPNFSCYLDMPRAVAMWAIYRKRWIARTWQLNGIRILADLNVAYEFYDLNMMGIPQGWKAYSTRGYTDRLDLLDREYAMACERAGGTDILFVVYGGGKKVKQHCMDCGYSWFSEHIEEAKHAANQDLDG